MAKTHIAKLAPVDGAGTLMLVIPAEAARELGLKAGDEATVAPAQARAGAEQDWPFSADRRPPEFNAEIIADTVERGAKLLVSALRGGTKR